MIKRERLIEIMNDQYDGDSETFNAEVAADLILDEIEKSPAQASNKAREGLLSELDDARELLEANEAPGCASAVTKAIAALAPKPDSTGPAETGEMLTDERCIHCNNRMTADEVEYLTNACNACETQAHAHWQAIEDEEPTAALTPSAPITAAARDDGARERARCAHIAKMHCYHSDQLAKDIANSIAACIRDPGYVLRDLETQQPLASLPTPASDVPGEALNKENSD